MGNVRVVNSTALSQSQHSGLREGSVVVGRVLEKTGSLYTISLAGKMISVRSKENLEVGSTFRGTIKIVDGKKVEIALLRGEGKDASSGSTRSPTAASEIIEQRLASLGLEKNEVSMRLLDFMTTLGMKLDTQKMKKALSKGKASTDSGAEALEAPEKESARKSEIWLLGDENGVDISDEELEKMLQRDAETLVEFNSPSEKDFRHWFVLPFDWDYMGMSGSLKVLEKFPDRIVEKIIIDIEDSYRFFLEFDKNKLKKVTAFGCETDALRMFLLKNGFPNVEVEGVDGDEKIFSVLKGFSAEV